MTVYRDRDVCKKCGELHDATHCGGHTNAKCPNDCQARHLDRCPLHPRFAQCRNQAGRYTSHPEIGNCSYHGGNRPLSAKWAAKELVRREGEKLLERAATYGLPQDITAEEAMLREVRVSAGIVDWLRVRVSALDPEAIAWAEQQRFTINASEYPGVNIVEGAGIHALLQLYLKERQYHTLVCTKVIAAGLAERQVRAVEKHSQLVGELLRAALDAAGVTREQEQAAFTEVQRRLVLLKSA